MERAVRAKEKQIRLAFKLTGKTFMGYRITHILLVSWALEGGLCLAQEAMTRGVRGRGFGGFARSVTARPLKLRGLAAVVPEREEFDLQLLFINSIEHCVPTFS